MKRARPDNCLRIVSSSHLRIGRTLWFPSPRRTSTRRSWATNTHWRVFCCAARQSLSAGARSLFLAAGLVDVPGAEKRRWRSPSFVAPTHSLTALVPRAAGGILRALARAELSRLRASATPTVPLRSLTSRRALLPAPRPAPFAGAATASPSPRATAGPPPSSPRPTPTSSSPRLTPPWRRNSPSSTTSRDTPRSSSSRREPRGSTTGDASRASRAAAAPPAGCGRGAARGF